MRCPTCQADNAAVTKFCQECGTALPRPCARCGHENAAVAKFCVECGQALRQLANAPVPPGTPDADRRQASIVFADISGYTSLCARSDPEEITLMLGRFFDAMERTVEHHGGRVFDRAGDAVMVVFGAPIAHGDDALRAARAALAMHAAAARLRDCEGKALSLHIGAASGVVVAATIAGGGQSKYSVTGDTVNLAARLVALAAPGETVISDALYREVATSVDVSDAELHALKGVGGPVPVRRLRGLRSAPTERLPFVGRQVELRQLVGALQTLRESGCGATVLLRGEAGIGKSRLVDEVRARADALGFQPLAGSVLDFGVGQGQGAIPTMIRALLGVTAQDDDDARHNALRAAIDGGRVVGDEALFVSEWLGLVASPAQQALYAAMDNATRERRAGETLAGVLARAAQLQQLLVCIEDIHWAAPELLRHVAALARASTHAPMMVLLTSRVDGDPLDKAWRSTVHGCALTTIDLSPLRPQEAQLLAGALVEASSRFALQCIERAEGNPLFLEQLLRVAQGDAASVLLPSVPATIQGLVQGRVDRLAARDRAVLQAAAVVGKRYALGDLRAISGDPQADCEALVAVDLVRADGADFMFAHALVQEAVYASMLKSRRRELHLAAATWFGEREPVLRAEHLDRANDPAAARAYWRAAEVEQARSRFDSALRLVERGVALAADDTGASSRLGLLRGELLRETGRSTESIAAFAAVAEVATDDADRCGAWMGVAAGHRITGNFAAAIDALARAQPIAERLGLEIECSRIHHLRGNLYFAQGRSADCGAEHALAMRYAEQAGDTDCQAQALSGLGDAEYARGRMRSALGYFRRCVALSDGKLRIAGANRCMVGHCLWYENELPAAIADVRAVCDDARRVGVVPLQVFALSSYTQLLTEAGQFDRAEETFADALNVARAAGSRRYESTLLLFAAEASLRRGDHARAAENLQLALELATQTGLGFIGAAVHARRARVAPSAEERAAALAAGELLLRDSALLHSQLWFYRDAIEACLAAGEWPQALRYADALEATVRAEPLPWVDLMVERARSIAGYAQDRADAAALARLRQVRDRVIEKSVGWALAGIDAALS